MSVARSAFRFAVGTIFSRLSGLIRDIVVAGMLGAGALNDAFVIAQRIPNLLRDMLAEGALGSSFTKVYTSLKQSNPEAADRLLFQMIYLGLVFMTGLITLGMIFAPQLVALMSQESVEDHIFTLNAATMTKILFPSLGMSVLGAIAMGALYEKGKFFLNAVIPILANIGVIVGGLYFGDLLLVYAPEWTARSGDPQALGLAWGTLLGFILQMSCALWNIRQSLINGGRGLLSRIPWSPEVKEVLWLMGPAAIASSAAPINVIVNTNFATDVGPGAVTWLNYAFRILQLPVGIFGVAVGVAALPTLTRAVTAAGRKVNEQVSQQLQFSLTFVTWLLAPCMIYCFANYEAIIRFLFLRGKFTEADVIATGQALFAYAVGMIAYGWIKVLTSFFYSVDRTKFAMRVSLLGIAINFGLNALLAKPMGHIGLALTSSLTLSFNAFLLSRAAKSMGVDWDRTSMWRSVLGLILAGAAAYGLCLLINLWQPFAFAQNVWSGRLSLFLDLSLSGAALVLCYGLAAMKVWELNPQRVRSLVMSRIRRKP